MSARSDGAGGSPIRELMRRLDRGEDVLSLGSGEAAFDPPAALIELAARAMREDGNRYTSSEGLPALRRAIVDHLLASTGASVDPDREVVVTVGCMEAILLAATVLVRPGDRVLVPDPGWGVAGAVLARLGARVGSYPLVERPGWEIDPAAIVDRIVDGVRLVVVNTPSNPTGAVLSREGFDRVVQSAARVGAVVLSDEVYDSYVYEGEHASCLGVAGLEHVVLANSFSKTFAITGWRLGYAVARPELTRRMVAVKETVSLCSPSAPQRAVAEFLGASGDYRRWARELCRETMTAAAARVRALAGVHCPLPRAGFYLFPDLSAIEPCSNTMAARCLEGGVGVIPGAFFGSRGEGRVRLAIADRYDRLAPALGRLESVLRA